MPINLFTSFSIPTEIWYEVFIWCLFSSIFVYVFGAAIAFFTLRKHKFGRYLRDQAFIACRVQLSLSSRFYSLMILFMGFVIPMSLGVVSSASIAWVYKTSSFRMQSSHAVMWGVGQTCIHAVFGLTRILATL